MSLCGALVNIDIASVPDHVATTWQVAEDSAFKNIIRQSIDDTINLKVIEFPDLVLDKNKKYFGRARIRTLSGGWGKWHNLDVFTSQPLDVANNFYKIPSRIGSPRIKTIDGEGNLCDKSDHPIMDFRVVADGYSVVGNTRLVATSWYIEDLDRNVIWKRENVPYIDCDNTACNVSNQDPMHVCYSVSDIILENNKIYRVRCCFHNETNDTSDMSSYTIKTCNEKNAAIKAYLNYALIDNRTSSITNRIELNMPFDQFTTYVNGLDAVRIELKIVEKTETGELLAFSSSATPNNPIITIGENVLSNNKLYIVKYRTSNVQTNASGAQTWEGDNWEAMYMSTFI